MRRRALTWCALLALAVMDAAPPIVGAALPRQAPAPSFQRAAVSRADALADIEALFRTIENVHPNPYDIVSREAVQAERKRVEAALPDPVTWQELWFRISPLVASLGDGHTRLNYPGDFVLEQSWVTARETSGGDKNELPRQAGTSVVKVFPPYILGLDDQQHLVVTSEGSTGLRRGDRLLSINGRNADALLAEWVHRTSGDSQSRRAIVVADDFHRLLLVHSMNPPYTVAVADADGRERTVAVDGVPLAPQPRSQFVTSGSRSFSYRAIAPGVGYMDFTSMDSDLGKFKKALAAMFRQVAADSVRTLVVDLRRNEGGSEEYGNELLRYVTTKPYRNWGGRELKRSKEFRSAAKSYFPPVLRWLPVQYLIADGRKLWMGPVGTLATWPGPPPKAPKRAEPFFSGPVCVLDRGRSLPR